MIPLLLLTMLAQSPWPVHTIDRESQGADGVRLADVNGDGRLDIVTGWEEGGAIRVCYQPERAKIRETWPCEQVGSVGDPEDAVAVDLDGDGRVDIVSSSEGNTRAMHVHWNRPGGWVTEALPAAAGVMQWMFATPMQVDGRHGIDLVAAGKNDGAWIGWFEAPANPRDLKAWRWHPIRRVGWVMTIDVVDMNGNGRQDILVSDRRGPARGVFWLENTGKGDWPEHKIGGADREVMFITRADLDGDGLEDVLAAAKDREIQVYRRLDPAGLKWETSVIPLPETAGTAKAVRVADLDGDGRKQIVFSCERAAGALEGVMVLKQENGQWRARSLAGAPGVKYDLIELLDLTGNGRLDVLTCEESDNLGVIWYENRP
ncbi:MAG TPA: VCBS repeat-containing protein [Bryobacteraceae bacterium]|nr:hypothetical protein [Bryobacterales bacterium]HRJ18791.1 VCBS repeat-containing protein [Bryobacteraceae bacterium]